MFRLNRVFDNGSTVLIKITGEIQEADLEEWIHFLRRLSDWSGCEIILDFCAVAPMTAAAIAALASEPGSNVYFVNGSMSMRAVVTSLGHANRLLDKDSVGTGLPIRWESSAGPEIAG
jgi:hypothetical protein